MPEKQDRLSNAEPMKSAEQQEQMLVEEAKQRFPINQEEEYLIVTYAQQYDNPNLSRQMFRQ